MDEKRLNILNSIRKKLNESQKNLLDDALNKLESDELKFMVLKLIEIANPQQLEAILHNHEKNGPLLILAGAGSGKTAVLTRRIVYLLLSGVSQEDILAVTFTNKAAAEMRARIKLVFSRIKEFAITDEMKNYIDEIIEKIDTMSVSTFHSACLKILRDEFKGDPGAKYGYTYRFKIPNFMKIKDIIDSVMLTVSAKVIFMKPDEVYAEICKIKEELLTEEDMKKQAKSEVQKIAYKIFSKFNFKMRKANFVDFSDMLYLTNKLFDDFPDILKKYREKFQYILIDEYQDTNKAQYEILNKLAGDKPTLFVVGDDDQSIYGWRGVDIRNILDFKKDYPSCKIIKLEINYRSTENILKVANEIFKNKPAELRKILKVNAANTDERFKNAANVYLTSLLTDKEEMQFVIKKINELVSSGVYDYKDIAILFRINDQSNMIMKHLEKAKIDSYILGASRSLFTDEVKLLKNYIEFFTDYKDEMLLKLLKSNPISLERSTIAQIGNLHAKEENKKYEVLKEIVENKRNISREVTEFEFKETLSNESLAKIKKFVKITNELAGILKTSSIFNGVDYLIHKLEIDKILTDKKNKRRNALETFIELVKDFDKTNDVKIFSDFSDNVVAFIDKFNATVREADFSTETDKNKVTLMTLHSSKGLEFPVIFFIALEDGICPFFLPGKKYKKKELREHIEEEKRLFYVGVTRAKYVLHLSYAQERYWFNKRVSWKPSRFLKLLSKEYFDFEKKKLSFFKSLINFIKNEWAKKKLLYTIILLILIAYTIQTHFSFIEKISAIVNKFF